MINEMPPKEAPRNIVAGEITAWRAWRVYYDGGQLCLQSTGMETLWVPGVPMSTMRGYRWGLQEGAGVHAFKTKAEVMRKFPPKFGFIVGEVELWGEIVEHDNGYRAEYGAVKTLTHASSLAQLQHAQKRYLPEHQIISKWAYRRAVVKSMDRIDIMLLFAIGFGLGNIAVALYNLAKLLFK